jgi:hypothetical protein
MLCSQLLVASTGSPSAFTVDNRRSFHVSRNYTNVVDFNINESVETGSPLLSVARREGSR